MANVAKKQRSLNLIAWDNGVGLSRDLRLLASGLRAAGFDVHISAIGRGKLRKWFRPVIMRTRLGLKGLAGRGARFDANIMLEHIRPEDMGAAKTNFFIPNPEWCLPSDVALLDRVDGVLTKTHHAKELFAARGCRSADIGFTSEDRLDRTVAKERTFFHLAGRSKNKGTERLIALWQRHLEWPRLTILQSPRTAKPIEPPAANIEHRIDYIDDAELKRLQNSYRFHLCPSETEGFGHYIVEAMGVGAIVVSTDAPPMNELVDATRGVLVAYDKTDVQHLATTYFFDEQAMEAAVERLIAMPEAELDRLGANARTWFERNDAEFVTRLRVAMDSLLDANG